MAQIDLFNRYFDEGWTFDDGIDHFDTSSQGVITIVGALTLDPPGMHYVSNNELDIVITCLMEVDFTGIVSLDLLPLIPEKFHTSPILTDYVDALELGVGTWLGKIDDLQSMINVEEVGEDYIGYLAALIGLKFLRTSTTTITDMRKQLREAMTYYKTKGTYESLQRAIFLYGYSVEVEDMYTNDYVTFVDVGTDTPISTPISVVEPGAVGAGKVWVDSNRLPWVLKVRDVTNTFWAPASVQPTFTEWFVAGYPEENPPGLDASYYKSPHFGTIFLLDQLYGTFPDEYLWHDAMLGNLPELVNQIRPINTVPHITGRLLATTRQDGIVETIPTTKINSIITTNWIYDKHYFDGGWNVDDGVFFDQSFSAFINALTIFKVGIGNKGVLPTHAGFVLADIQYTGSVYRRTVSDGTVTIEMIIPNAVAITGVSEIGLFQSDNTTMVAAITLPDCDKTVGMELKIVLEIRP